MTYATVTGRKVKFALVGCGRIAANHFGAIEKHADRCELVDICDVSPEVRKATAERTKATPHESLTAMLEKTDADCVILTTPSGLHPSQAIQVAKSGRHVLTEKPMATRWKDGRDMVDASAA